MTSTATAATTWSRGGRPTGASTCYRGDGDRRLRPSGAVERLERLQRCWPATGDLDGDGHADLLARDGSGHLWRFPGTGSRELGKPVQLPGSWGGYSTITGFGDFTGDGRPDLFVGEKGAAGRHPARAAPTAPSVTRWARSPGSPTPRA